LTDWTYASAPGSFLFSLRNNDDLAPFKAPLRGENGFWAIAPGRRYGPTFGYDLVIHDNANSNADSRAYFGHTYQVPPGYTFKQTNTNTLLAGSYKFTPSEIEVLYII
jgi:hypothetical protein